MKASAGPLLTTVATLVFTLCAMKPIVEKTAKPDENDVSVSLDEI